jgi:hypothetical protein
MREWLARAIQAKRKLPVVRRVLAKRCNWGWRAWTWIQKDPVRAGLMDCGFMGIGLALTVHLSQQFSEQRMAVCRRIGPRQVSPRGSTVLATPCPAPRASA